MTTVGLQGHCDQEISSGLTTCDLASKGGRLTSRRVAPTVRLLSYDDPYYPDEGIRATRRPPGHCYRGHREGPFRSPFLASSAAGGTVTITGK